MKKAIVTGATGFIGSLLVKTLLDHNVEVLALGRKENNKIDPKRSLMLEGSTYLQLDMSKIDLLADLANEIGWNTEDSCVFYNVAWGGNLSLSDLNIAAQHKNVAWSANAIRIAKTLNCEKFVHVGTMEEAFTNAYLSLDFNTNTEYNRHVIYSVAKITSKKILKVISRQEKIDLIFATNSHVMGANDDKDSFLQVTLQKLINGDELIFSAGSQIFDVISVCDLTRAYYLIGKHGKHHMDYWVGSGQPRPLMEYVEIMANLYPSGKELQFGKMPYNDISLNLEDFSIESLTMDTGFKPEKTYEDNVHDLYDWLTSKEKI